MINATVAIWNEFGEMLENINVETTTDVTIVSDDGDVVLPIQKGAAHDVENHIKSANRDLYRSINKVTRKILMWQLDDIDMINYGYFIDAFDSDIKMIPYRGHALGVTLIKEILNSYHNSERELLGLLVTDENNPHYVANVTHPIVAFLLSVGVFKLPEKGKIAVYEQTRNLPGNNLFYNDLTERIEVDGIPITFARYHQMCEDKGFTKEIQKAAKKYWENIIQAVAPNILFHTKPKKYKADVFHPLASASSLLPPNDSMLPYHVMLSASDDVIDDTQCFYIPLQVLAGNIVTPYVGDVYVDINAKYAITTQTPTGNINMSTRHRTMHYHTNLDGVCTGRYSNSSFRGMQTLSKINVSSLHTKYFVNLHELDIMKGGIEVSRRLFNLMSE